MSATYQQPPPQQPASYREPGGVVRQRKRFAEQHQDRHLEEADLHGDGGPDLDAEADLVPQRKLHPGDNLGDIWHDRDEGDADEDLGDAAPLDDVLDVVDHHLGHEAHQHRRDDEDDRGLRARPVGGAVALGLTAGLLAGIRGGVGLVVDVLVRAEGEHQADNVDQGHDCGADVDKVLCLGVVYDILAMGWPGERDR